MLAPQFNNEITTTLMEMVTLGIKVFLEDTDIRIKNVADEDIRREVGRSIFPDLAGVLVNLKRYEKSKKKPDQKIIDFYQLAAKALFAQHARFRHLADNDVENVFKTISPILKKCNLAIDKAEEEKIINMNRQVLQELIDKTSSEKLKSR